MVEVARKKQNQFAFKRVGTGRQAELADIRDSDKKKTKDGEENKESIIQETVEIFPKKGAEVFEAVSWLFFSLPCVLHTFVSLTL